MFDIYVINLEERNDRWEYIKNEFKDFNLIRIDAIKDENGWKGCFLSHIKCIKIAKEKQFKCIKIAKEKQFKYIIVIEDDCKIVIENFSDNLKTIINYLENNINEWDIFMGGITNVWNYNKIIKLNSNINIIGIDTGKTSHFIIYNSNCYDFFINHNIELPIDKCWHNKLRGLTCIPFIAIQYNNISDIEIKYVNYDNRFNSIEKNFFNLINKKI